MIEPRFTRIDAAGSPLPVADQRCQLSEGEAVHRELRTTLANDYLAEVDRLFADGTRLTQLVDAGEVQAIAVWRVFHTTYTGRLLEVDDLVTREAGRSNGYGAGLLAYMQTEARRLGCTGVTLNSACHRTRAHQFYFREGYKILAFHFAKVA